MERAVLTTGTQGIYASREGLIINRKPITEYICFSPSPVAGDREYEWSMEQAGAPSRYAFMEEDNLT